VPGTPGSAAPGPRRGRYAVQSLSPCH
jgi:hypothetical protein